MANIVTTMPSGVTKPATQHFVHSPISRGFSKLLGALASYIEAERDITHAWSFDPAFDEWTRDAEAARTQVLTLIDTVRSARMIRSEDLPLSRMAMMCYALIEAHSTEEFLSAQKVLSETPSLFACLASGTVGWRTRQMLRSAEMRIAEIAGLPTYVDPLEIEAVAVTATCAADAVHAEDPHAMMAAPIPA